MKSCFHNDTGPPGDRRVPIDRDLALAWAHAGSTRQPEVPGPHPDPRRNAGRVIDDRRSAPGPRFAARRTTGRRALAVAERSAVHPGRHRRLDPPLSALAATPNRRERPNPGSQDDAQGSGARARPPGRPSAPHAFVIMARPARERGSSTREGPRSPTRSSRRCDTSCSRSECRTPRSSPD